MYNLMIRKCTSPPLLAPRLKIFKLKFTTPPGIELWTCWTRGRHATIWANAASSLHTTCLHCSGVQWHILYVTSTDGWHWSWLCFVCVQLPGHTNLICGNLNEQFWYWQCFLMHFGTRCGVFQWMTCSFVALPSSALDGPCLILCGLPVRDCAAVSICHFHFTMTSLTVDQEQTLARLKFPEQEWWLPIIM